MIFIQKGYIFITFCRQNQEIITLRKDVQPTSEIVAYK